jgi:flavorubredoxin
MMTRDQDNRQAVKISDRVYWVGALDWDLRDFHGYLTSEGSTYNAFLVLADKPVLIDTVKPAFKDEMMDRIASVIDPSKIEIIVSNHSEMDHSGAIPEVLSSINPSEIIASDQGVKALKDHFHWDRPVRTIADGERIDVGGAHLRFNETRMLHWPDSMFTFYEEEGILFSNDAFGSHLASVERYEDELSRELTMGEAAKYYANILLPYSPLVTKLIAKLPELNYDLKMIAPDHGPIWRNNPIEIVEAYANWAQQQPRRKAVIMYDTMWESTTMMARAIETGLRQDEVETVIMPLSESHRSDVITELLDAGAFLVGSPTLNGLILPPIADVMTYIKGLKPKNLIGAAFGSYGWAPASITQVEKLLAELGVDLVAPGIKAKYVPTEETLTQCTALGSLVAQRLQEMTSIDKMEV